MVTWFLDVEFLEKENIIQVLSLPSSLSHTQIADIL